MVTGSSGSNRTEGLGKYQPGQYVTAVVNDVKCRAGIWTLRN